MSFLTKIPTLALVLLSAASVITGDYFGKLWSTNARPLYLILASLGYLGSALFYLPALLKEDLVITSILWSLTSIIGFLIIGLVIFKETISGLQTIGVIIGIIALIILSVTQK